MNSIALPLGELKFFHLKRIRFYLSDVVGEEPANIKEIELNEKDFIYINNLPSTKDHYDSPWMKNFNWHCHERSKQAKQNLKGMRKKSFNNVYKKLTNVDDKKKDFSLFPVNPTTTQIIDFNLSEQKITLPKKGVPRGFEQEGYQNFLFLEFSKPKMDEIKLYRGKANMEMSAFYRELILCQSAWDKKISILAFIIFRWRSKFLQINITKQRRHSLEFYFH